MRTMVEGRDIVKIFKIKESSGSAFKDFFFPKQQSFRALDDVSIEIGEGKIFGLLGGDLDL